MSKYDDEFKRFELSVDTVLLEDFEKVARAKRMTRAVFMRTLMLQAVKEFHTEKDNFERDYCA